MDSKTAMPQVASFIDALRKTFGTEYINGILQRGVRGEPVFHAHENGYEIGTPLPPAKAIVSWDEQGVSHVTEMTKGK